VALGVSALGLTQLWVLGRNRSGLKAGPYWRALALSWMSLPGSVKLWLFFLNAVFLTALFFEAHSKVVVLAYVATGPLLLASIFLQGGLTRATGLGHLIAWLPLCVWLVEILADGAVSGPEFAYLGVLLGATVICLAFDIYDLRRRLGGERAVLGKDYLPRS
jgi:hypothetical protein